MKTVPIAFAFDNNLVLPACICISSLLMNAKEETFYDIFILYSSKINLHKEQLDELPKYFNRCRIQYRVVDNTFDQAFEIRGITAATYYRLLIPELIPEYDKVIYADVDIIFRMDLSELYNTEIGENYIAATRELGMNLMEDGQKHIHSLPALSVGNYIQAGFIIMNTKAILKNNIHILFKEWSYNPQIQISAESETKRSIFREKDKTKRSKKESAQHSKSRNKSFVMTSVSAL